MSIAVMDRVWKQSTAKGGALLTLLALADWSNDDGFAYPSVPKLAQKTRLSRRQVQNILRELQAAGDIVVVEQRGRTHTNLYHLVRYVDDPPKENAKSATQNVQEVHVSPPIENVKAATENAKSATQNVQSATQNVKPTAPKPSVHVKEPSENHQHVVRANPSLRQAFEVFWSAYPRGHGNKQATWVQWQRLDPDEEMVEVILLALEGWKTSDRWQRGYVKSAQKWVEEHWWDDDPPPPTADDELPDNVRLPPRPPDSVSDDEAEALYFRD